MAVMWHSNGNIGRTKEENTNKFPVQMLNVYLKNDKMYLEENH